MTATGALLYFQMSKKVILGNFSVLGLSNFFALISFRSISTMLTVFFYFLKLDRTIKEL